LIIREWARDVLAIGCLVDKVGEYGVRILEPAIIGLVVDGVTGNEWVLSVLDAGGFAVHAARVDCSGSSEAVANMIAQTRILNAKVML
jgi:hypothetical protein